MVIIIREEVKKDPDNGIFFRFLSMELDMGKDTVEDMVEDNKQVVDMGFSYYKGVSKQIKIPLCS